MSKWDDETHLLAEYRPLLVLLDKIYRTFLIAQFGFSEDVREIRVFIKDVVDSGNSTPNLELTEPLKSCVFAVHVVELAKKNALQQRVAKESRTLKSLIVCFRNTFKHLHWRGQWNFHCQN